MSKGMLPIPEDDEELAEFKLRRSAALQKRAQDAEERAQRDYEMQETMRRFQQILRGERPSREPINRPRPRRGMLPMPPAILPGR
jgi:hypothetical protein